MPGGRLTSKHREPQGQTMTSAVKKNKAGKRGRGGTRIERDRALQTLEE